MRKEWAFLAVASLCGLGMTCDIIPPDSQIHADLSPEELAAGPSYHQMKGALLNDVRIWRELDKKFETEGRKEMPKVITFVNNVPTCANDLKEIEVYILRSDLSDQSYRIEERAYYCREEGVYYYHYQGGPKRLNLWMGPYRIERKRVKPDELKR